MPEPSEDAHRVPPQSMVRSVAAILRRAPGAPDDILWFDTPRWLEWLPERVRTILKNILVTPHEMCGEMHVYDSALAAFDLPKGAIEEQRVKTLVNAHLKQRNGQLLIAVLASVLYLCGALALIIWFAWAQDLGLGSTITAATLGYILFNLTTPLMLRLARIKRSPTYVILSFTAYSAAAAFLFTTSRTPLNALATMLGVFALMYGAWFLTSALLLLIQLLMFSRNRTAQLEGYVLCNLLWLGHYTKGHADWGEYELVRLVENRVVNLQRLIAHDLPRRLRPLKTSGRKREAEMAQRMAAALDELIDTTSPAGRAALFTYARKAVRHISIGDWQKLPQSDSIAVAIPSRVGRSVRFVIALVFPLIILFFVDSIDVIEPPLQSTLYALYGLSALTTITRAIHPDAPDLVPLLSRARELESSKQPSP